MPEWEKLAEMVENLVFLRRASAHHMHIMPLQTFGISVLQAEGWLRLRMRRVQFWAGEVV